MAKETNQVLGHGADADGIEEYDNPLPDWWLGLFLLTVIFGIGYGVNYHFIAGDSQAKRYEAEMARAQVLWPAPDASAPLAMDAGSIEAGEAVFLQTCASCHKADMTGGIGPNLVDAIWIHGNAPEQVVATIMDGVPAKGMPAWGPILGPTKVQQAAAYVLSKQGSAPSEGTATEGGSEGTAHEMREAEVLDGKTIYEQNCLACHGADMKGLVGPNLIDAEWIHAGELDQIRNTITVGVPEKGMIQWAKIDAVARFVHEQAAAAN
jgi:cytochrome c oxidase cbb3-type subunit III